MRIHLVSFGTLKTPGMADAFNHYAERLKHFHSLELHELKAQPHRDEQIEVFKKTLQKIAVPRKLFILDERGKNISTAQWAQALTQSQIQGLKSCVFAIGPAYGFSEIFWEDLETPTKISLGSQTLPHELARVVLIEQLYRASSLAQNHPYHHE